MRKKERSVHAVVRQAAHLAVLQKIRTRKGDLTDGWKNCDERRKSKKSSKKERMKAMETPKQKRDRRLAKKLKKEEEKKAKIDRLLPQGVDYTNLNNPFNDPHLTQTFVWTKKLEAEGFANLPMRQIEKLNRERTRKNFAEMEELKKNREAREAAREDLEMIRRDEERRGNFTWEQTEEMFHLNQARLRSEIRLREGREKPIDYLARYIRFDDIKKEDEKSGGDEEEYNLELPLVYLQGLTAKDFEDLLEDIKVYMRIDHVKNLSWWQDFRTVVDDELRKLVDDVRTTSLRDSIHGSVQHDVAKILDGKTHEELARLEEEVKRKIQEGREGTDVAYWESLLTHLQVHMAKARIRARHKEMFQYRLRKIKEEQTFEFGHQSTSENVNKLVKEKCPGKLDSSKQLSGKVKTNFSGILDEIDGADEEAKEQKWRLLSDEEMEAITLEMYERGSYSPIYGDEKQAMPGIEILNETEDERKRVEARLKYKDSEIDNSAYSSAEREMLTVAKRGMTNDESSFSVEAPLEAQTFLWSEKYRPRKPRYFNRVHTGFEWNKYNQTHYDMDNPPPKIVQGYRFNIFYPDLLDVTETPSFTVTPCDDPDFAVLRFHAGPPYEDIAFKIVNREWEISHKHGYKCQFANGIFQLWFFFKRYRYRR